MPATKTPFSASPAEDEVIATLKARDIDEFEDVEVHVDGVVSAETLTLVCGQITQPHLKHWKSTLRLYSSGQWAIASDLQKTSRTGRLLTVKVYVRFLDAHTKEPLPPGPSGSRWQKWGKNGWRRLIIKERWRRKRRTVFTASGRNNYIRDNFEFIRSPSDVRAELLLKSARV